MEKKFKLEGAEYSVEEILNLLEALGVELQPKAGIDRVGDWDKFAQEMHDYIGGFTVAKYGGKQTGFDLMSVTEPRVAVWNVLKYALRLWFGRGKRHDIYKIAHYSQIAWTKGGGMNGDLESMGIIGEEKSG